MVLIPRPSLKEQISKQKNQKIKKLKLEQPGQRAHNQNFILDGH